MGWMGHYFNALFSSLRRTNSSTRVATPSMMLSKLVTSVVLASTVLALVEGEVKQFFLREPDNQTAIEGEQVGRDLKDNNKGRSFSSICCGIQRQKIKKNIKTQTETETNQFLHI